MFYGVSSVVGAAVDREITLAGVTGKLSGNANNLQFNYVDENGYKTYLSLAAGYRLHAGDCGSVSPISSSSYVGVRDIVNDFFARLGIARIHVVLSQSQFGFEEAVVGGTFGVGGKVVTSYECNSTRKGKDVTYKLRSFIVDLSEHPNFRYGYALISHFLNPQGA